MIKPALLLLLALTTAPLVATQQSTPPAKSFWQTASTTPTARVRQGTELCPQELAACQARQGINQQALAQFLQLPTTPTTVPAIGVACSGGGMRAAIATLGLLSGLEKIGLLDAITYLASLSGSTWTASSWLQQGGSIQQLRATLKKRLVNPFGRKNIPTMAIAKALVNKYLIGRSLGINDIYGCLIASTFLAKEGTSGLATDLADFADQTAQGSVPVPIFTSVIGQTSPSYEWMEYSPFEMGSTFLKAWIPAEAIGKTFVNGISYDLNPEEHMSYVLGICSSAYAGGLVDVIQLVAENAQADYGLAIPLGLNSWISTLLPWSTDRVASPSLPNFCYQLANTPLNTYSTLSLVDAGMATNIPCVPLLRRNTKIYIICDAGSDANSPAGTDMHEVEAYARQHNLTFPSFDYNVLATAPLSIWADQNDPTVPLVIHVPNHNAFSTLKFSYSENEFETLCGAIEQAVVEHRDVIAQAIKRML